MANVLCIAPYIAWMVLMMVGLPYWVRTVVSGLLLAILFFNLHKPFKPSFSSLALGILGGVVVLIVWILPETIQPPTFDLQPPTWSSSSSS